VFFVSSAEAVESALAAASTWRGEPSREGDRAELVVSWHHARRALGDRDSVDARAFAPML
jgi:hypothetical protein